MNYEIEDIMETFGCDRETAEEIDDLLWKIVDQKMEEKIEQEVPF